MLKKQNIKIRFIEKYEIKNDKWKKIMFNKYMV